MRNQSIQPMSESTPQVVVKDDPPAYDSLSLDNNKTIGVGDASKETNVSASSRVQSPLPPPYLINIV